MNFISLTVFLVVVYIALVVNILQTTQTHKTQHTSAMVEGTSVSVNLQHWLAALTDTSPITLEMYILMEEFVVNELSDSFYAIILFEQTFLSILHTVIISK